MKMTRMLAACVLMPLYGLTENLPEARFRGAPIYDLIVTNVSWAAATKDYSTVTFDLSWSFSWRAKWVEPAATSATGKDLEIENWDAVWVFVKFLPEKDSKESRERNHWQHATLSTAAADHRMPDGATSTVKISDDPSTGLGAGGPRGTGVFIYRDAIGHGVNNFKGITLRWMHGADKVDPAKAAIKVHPIAMVYVPEGPFKLGSTAESGFWPFPDGPDVPLMRYDGEENYENLPEGLRRVIESTTSKDGGPYIRWGKQASPNGTTDGAWRGGPTIPFLVDAEWNAPAAEGTRGRLVGPFAGRLWSTHTFVERSAGGTPVGPLNDDYPTGYDAFYCMKYEMTQGQYVDFLNSLPPDVAAKRAIASHETRSDAGMFGEEVTVNRPGASSYTVTEKAGNTVVSSVDLPTAAPTTLGAGGALDGGEDDGMGALIEELMMDTQEAKEKPKILPPVYSARCPFRKMPGVAGGDVRAFAVWAGLRPMTSLELVKSISGPHDPDVPDPSAVWANAEGHLTVADPGLPTERIIKGKSNWGGCRMTRVGSCATATSDRSTARATYWGILEFDGTWAGVVPLPHRVFRGTHGNGAMPAGTPGASFRRGFDEFKEIPADWPVWWDYIGRFSAQTCRLVASADNRARKPVDERVASKPAEPLRGAQFKPADARRVDIPRIANVKWEAGTKDYSTVSFDLAWENSWRAKWEEPADKNVTGKPLTVESWDAAWVFVKVRLADAQDDAHATLAAERKDHEVPAGATLDMGLNGDGSGGVGVFIHRSDVGHGPADFKNVKLRWVHGDTTDPSHAALKVHAIAMVYVPEGPFASRSPWGHALQTITTPDATKPGGHLESGPESLPLHPEWPNGYTAYYFMKYAISQGEYADLLNSMPAGNYNGGRYGAQGNGNAWRYSSRLYGFNGFMIAPIAAGGCKADVPDRMCNLISWPDIQSFMAWAGLRPPTNLEYEKACRGPRAVARGADAWTPAACAPAAGLDTSVLDSPSAVGPGPSYWGIRELSFSGCVQEWPAVIQNEFGAGVGYKGQHGNGSPWAPEEWPWSAFGDGFSGGIWRNGGYGTVGQWINATELISLPWEVMDGSRTGRYGVHAARTATIQADVNAPLQIDALPNLAVADVGIFYLSGGFRNDGDKPLKVEMAAPLPDACFPEGAASRAFTAAPKAVTPFNVLTVLTGQTAAGAVESGQMLPIRIQTPGGDVLATTLVRLRMATSDMPVIHLIEGGEVPVRMINATARTFVLALAFAPQQGLTIAEKNLRVEVAANASPVALLHIPRQAVAEDGTHRIPYRLTVADGASQSGETGANLLSQSRWWVSRHDKIGPSMAGGGDQGALLPGLDLGALGERDKPAGVPEDLFQADVPPHGWQQVESGGGVPVAEAGQLPSRESSALAATRVIASAEREAVLRVKHPGPPKSSTESPFIVRVWLNGKPLYNSKSDAKGADKSCRLRAGVNTVLVSCESNLDAPVIADDTDVMLLDAKTGKTPDGMLFDMKRRE